jgi:hypothetical protein
MTKDAATIGRLLTSAKMTRREFARIPIADDLRSWEVVAG